MAAAEFTSAGVFAVVAEIMLDAVCVDLITVVTGGVGIIQGRTILLVIIFVILVTTVVVVIVALIVTVTVAVILVTTVVAVVT